MSKFDPRGLGGEGAEFFKNFINLKISDSWSTFVLFAVRNRMKTNKVKCEFGYKESMNHI